MNPRRLYRCRHERQLAGVAAGMAEYLDLDPTLVRVLWILSAFFGGFSILLYIILAFIIPMEPGAMPAPGSWQAAGPAWGTPPTQGAAGTESTGEASGAVAEPGAGSPPDGGAGTSHWGGAPAWPAPGPDSRPETRPAGRGAIVIGVLLVVFGAIALANALLPGWAGAGALGPAFLVALGVALLAGSIRHTAFER